ncbi:class I SAM-dependent methyltransferase [Streptomyces rhizosphaerihabitans]|uniref:class I SAM-dependent methyltransferase n=1 Tax=Streptomyces rhizosphaerihabitans TaxID=1266770 RepID=UPI0021C2096E|nr:class I SAM-dependent methyltransferase [Streptomyces rhizosphaerihabitans]MCT9011284.1 class I SAM-dependent methyltransferase [Streptomyces rhizosphaerihabitans]
MHQLEISDLITAVDPHTGRRLPVRRTEVIQQLRESGDERAARIVAGLAADQDGVLDPHAVDRLLISVHTELQRLSEELRIGERLVHVLGPLFTAIRAAARQTGAYRLVDVGCGLGYLVRWLAATDALGADVELVGVDLDATLVGEADRLARAEGLTCRFVHGNAFDLPEAATVYVSTGVLHHFRGSALADFFQAQAASPAHAFCHFDIAATPLAPLGAWIFHRARMRNPLGRHDGVVSARRAHSDETLLRAAAVPGIRALLYEPRGTANPFCTTLRPIIGVRPHLEAPLRRALGRDARHMVGPEHLVEAGR